MISLNTQIITKEKIFQGGKSRDTQVVISHFFYLIIYVPSIIFQLCRDGSSWVEPVVCLAQGHNAVTPLRLEAVVPRSRVKQSITEQLRSCAFRLPCALNSMYANIFGGFQK